MGLNNSGGEGEFLNTLTSHWSLTESVPKT